MRGEKSAFTGKRQFCALIEIVLITRRFEHVAQTDIFRVEGGKRTGSVAVKGRKQRNTALGGDHTRDGITGARYLPRRGEINAGVFVTRQFGGQTGESLLVEI